MKAERKEDRQKQDLSIPRRRFLQMTAAGALTAALAPEHLFANMFASAPAPIALQLYSVRDEIKKDIAGTLSKCAAVGFEAVETAFWPENMTIKQAGKYVRDAGLTVCSS